MSTPSDNAPHGHVPSDPAANAPAARQRARNRGLLIALFAVFFVPIAAAWLINLNHGLPPPKTNGEYLQPMRDLRAFAPKLADGGDYPWDPAARRWRVVIAPPPMCDAACTAAAVEVARKVDLVWQLLGKNNDQVDILWLGAPPAGAKRGPATRVLRADRALRDALPRVDEAGVPIYVVDPNGFVVLRYAPGFDASGLRTDLSRLLKVN